MAEGRRKDLNATACRSDGLLGGLGKAMGLHLYCPGQLAPSQDLDQALLGHQTLGAQAVRGDLVALELLEDVEVDDRVLDAERVLETLELGDPAGERHLAAFEGDRDGATGTLALHAPARGLASPAAYPAAHPFPGLRRPRRRLQIVNLHRAPPPAAAL